MSIAEQLYIRAHCNRKPNSSTFKDFLTKIEGLLRTLFLCEDFKGLENLEKNLRTFKDRQEPCMIMTYTAILMLLT